MNQENDRNRTNDKRIYGNCVRVRAAHTTLVDCFQNKITLGLDEDFNEKLIGFKIDRK